MKTMLEKAPRIDRDIIRLFIITFILSIANKKPSTLDYMVIGYILIDLVIALIRGKEKKEKIEN